MGNNKTRLEVKKKRNFYLIKKSKKIFQMFILIIKSKRYYTYKVFIGR